MHVDVRKIDEVIVVDLQGRLVAGTGDEVLREVMTELIGESWKRILLNLSQVTKVDSSGIGELVASVKLARRFETEVKLVRIQQSVLEILRLSQLVPLLDIYDSEEAAIASFDAAAEGDSGDS